MTTPLDIRVKKKQKQTLNNIQKWLKEIFFMMQVYHEPIDRVFQEKKDYAAGLKVSFFSPQNTFNLTFYSYHNPHSLIQLGL